MANNRYEAVSVTAASPAELAREVETLLQRLVSGWTVVSVSHAAHVPPETPLARAGGMMFTALIVTTKVGHDTPQAG